MWRRSENLETPLLAREGFEDYPVEDDNEEDQNNCVDQPFNEKRPETQICRNRIKKRGRGLLGLALIVLAVVSVNRVDTARIECVRAFKEYWCCALYSDRWVGCEWTACCRYAWKPVERRDEVPILREPDHRADLGDVD